MIDIEEIERTINELENTRDTSYRLCERLSWLYICRDHLKPPAMGEDARVELGGSEFLDACNGVPYAALMAVMDEHMETIRLMYPKSYESLMDKIRGLR